MEFTWLLVLTTALLLPLAFVLLQRGKNRRRLPPGPYDPPVLGNLLWWIPSNDGMYNLRAQRRLHTIYGPLLAVRKGSRLDVTISDRHLAYTALVGRGAALADRPDYAIRDFAGQNAATITSSNYGPHWRLLRRNFVAEVAHPDRVRLFAPVRAAVLSDLTDRLRRQQEEHGEAGVGNVTEMFQYAMFRLVLAMCFGELLDEAAVRDIESALRKLMIHSMAKLDIFAILPAITTRLFRGRLTAMRDMRCRLRELYLPLINARRARKKLGAVPPPETEMSTTTTLPHSYVDTLLDLRLSCDDGRALTDHEIDAMCSELLVQGTDTTVTALEWTMAELVKNPSIQEKLHDEITRSVSGDSQLGGNRKHVSEQDLKNMPYLRAVVLEGLRRHPPGPLLVVHAAAEDTELNGYVIPKGAPVNVMVADIAMDETWSRPTDFVPERFLTGGDGEGVDITCAREVRMCPFGAGRRVCPAIGVATLHLEYLVANLVSTFEWREVEGDEVDVVSERAEFAVVMEKTLRARLVPRRDRFRSARASPSAYWTGGVLPALCSFSLQLGPAWSPAHLSAAGYVAPQVRKRVREGQQVRMVLILARVFYRRCFTRPLLLLAAAGPRVVAGPLVGRWLGPAWSPAHLSAAGYIAPQMRRHAREGQQVRTAGPPPIPPPVVRSSATPAVPPPIPPPVPRTYAASRAPPPPVPRPDRRRRLRRSLPSCSRWTWPPSFCPMLVSGPGTGWAAVRGGGDGGDGSSRWGRAGSLYGSKVSPSFPCKGEAYPARIEARSSIQG
uniref:Uncharacterized protein n=1 Tax=Avena sativa TaxID=4498 RepID=A0ACD5ZV48_AVESA